MMVIVLTLGELIERGQMLKERYSKFLENRQDPYEQEKYLGFCSYINFLINGVADEPAYVRGLTFVVLKGVYNQVRRNEIDPRKLHRRCVDARATA